MASTNWEIPKGPGKDDGSFNRPPSRFREWITTDGPYTPEAGRYHLYVARACPWAHRTMIARELMGLQDAISISYVDPIRDKRSWAFTGGAYVDPLNGFEFLEQAYLASDPDGRHRVSVPVLWDRKHGRIVNNESSEILRMLSTVLAPLAKHPVELYPAERASEIDALSESFYEPVNNGVYKAGFAQNQRAYERAVRELFAKLDELDARLAISRFLFGDRLLESDIRLFTTLVRFDAVYQIHFKCSVRKLAEYPNLWPYCRDIYQWPGVKGTVDFEEIRRHYYGTHPTVNPLGIVAVMPELDFDAPPGREHLG
ncbi:MAG: glutathione S-transferase C-terminal domain-containing protein [Solirubrobacterales bacterium]|nr:glutathione S-transferase C-terminal domain-containing protein [Solirubrobacterales bacterium]